MPLQHSSADNREKSQALDGRTLKRRRRRAPALWSLVRVSRCTRAVRPRIFVLALFLQNFLIQDVPQVNTSGKFNHALAGENFFPMNKRKSRNLESRQQKCSRHTRPRKAHQSRATVRNFCFLLSVFSFS